MDPCLNSVNEFKLDNDSLLAISPRPHTFSSESPHDQDCDAVLKFLNQILVEEDLEEKPSMFHDLLALHTAEKSLYEVIGQKYPPSPPPSISIHPDAAVIYCSSFDNTSLQFKRGMEEASRFLPTPSNELISDLNRYELPQKPQDISTTVEESPHGLKGRKHQYPDDDDLKGMERNSKQFATYVEDFELSEMLDRVLLKEDSPPPSSVLPNGRRARTKRNEKQGNSVDLMKLLTSCAQSVAADDRRAAYEQLKQIMQHSSPTGDAYQRLAHVFATGLQARLAGTGTQLYASLIRRKFTGAEKLKAYQIYLTALPFKKLATAFANKMIASVASQATVLHIIDFGIRYGFQWPILIQHLSERVGGPLKLLRITGVEVPQPGFRPAERLEETGRRLANYCDRFGVPFEYKAIATHNWEAINIKDLKIISGEVVVVNSLFRFGRLLDETVRVESPREGVLKLIRKIKPDMLVNAVTNGSFSAPFFVTRFREALFYYSALFDMLDATLVGEHHPERVFFEQDLYGREVINVVACEGAERVERPETYKQWQVRHMRAGFKPVPLDHGILKRIRHKGGGGYDKDFVLDEDGCWMLQGWKGRIICASSCWVPA